VEVGSEGLRKRMEDLAGQLEDDLLGGFRAKVGGDGHLVRSREWAEWGSGNVDLGGVVPLSVELKPQAENFLAQFLNSSNHGEVFAKVVLSGPFFSLDGLFLGLFPGSQVLGPDSSEGDWSAFEGDPVDVLLWWDPGDLEGWFTVSLQVEFNFTTDWNVDLSNSQDLQTRVDNWRPDLNAGDNGGNEAWVDFVEFDLDRFQGFLRLEFSSDLTSNLSNGWDLEGGNQWKTKGGWDLEGHLVEEGSLEELEVVARFKESLDLLEVDSAVSEHISEGFGDGFHAEWQHAEVLILVFQIDVSFRTVGEGSLDGLEFLPQVLEFVEWAGGLEAPW